MGCRIGSNRFCSASGLKSNDVILTPILLRAPNHLQTLHPLTDLLRAPHEAQPPFELTAAEDGRRTRTFLRMQRALPYG
jgi:hypothetical protein